MRQIVTIPLKALGPVAAVPLQEALRAGSGAFLALLGAAGIVLWAADSLPGLALIAPFGASAVLIFAAVNSPLAQPWPVIVGNTSAALVAILICSLLPGALLAVPLSAGGAILVMALLRATHPPGGAVALTVALAATTAGPPEPAFAFLPVAAGSIFLVLCGMLWARLTGRRYPMRQFGAPGPTKTADPAPPERLGLSEAEIHGILAEYRQALNLGVEDFARLIGAAELRAASHHTSERTAGEIMSRDLITVRPDAPVAEVAAIFHRHGFTSLPVVAVSGQFLGVIFQLQLIAALAGSHQGEAAPAAVAELTAAQIMTDKVAIATEETPIGQLIPQLSAQGGDAVMVLDGKSIRGVVTQTDLIAALARAIIRRLAAPPEDQPNA